MALTNPVQAPLTSIVRSTPEQRVAEFQKNANNIYSKLSPYDASTGGIGFSQPFVYTKLTDSNLSKNLTKYDNQALPIGSTIRDVQRVGKFMASGTGLLFIGKQYLLQKQNAFNETRIYNPLSVLGATAKAGTLGLMDRPKRYTESGGTLLGTFMNALKGTVGINVPEQRISGTALGVEGNGPFSRYVGLARGTGNNTGKYAGVVRFETAMGASIKFESLWSGPKSNSNQSFFSKIKSTFANLIPSTNPTGMSSGDNGTQWVYRPEYIQKQAGPYVTFLKKNPTKLLDADVNPTMAKQHTSFYKTTPTPIQGTTLGPSSFHKYYPVDEQSGTSNLYAPDTAFTVNEPAVGNDGVNLYNKFKDMVNSFEPEKITSAQQRRSREMYTSTDSNVPSYGDIPGDQTMGSKSGANSYTARGGRRGKLQDALTLDSRLFAKVGNEKESYVHDQYNALLPIQNGKRNELPYQLTHLSDSNQSKDIIFFYFFDLINRVYLPFRATVSGITDQTSADWEEISYIGRADKLYMYKGFSRDVNITFTVYANSLRELIPMWTRINYLVGLTRPSKYTAGPAEAASKRFIYPPMVTLRMGDMFNDQPCVITSVGVNIPDDTNWETYRNDADGTFKYLEGLKNEKIITGVRSRQLPLKADITVSMKIMEKEISEVSGEHFAFDMTLSNANAKTSTQAKTEEMKATAAKQYTTPNPELNKVSDEILQEGTEAGAGFV